MKTRKNTNFIYSENWQITSVSCAILNGISHRLYSKNKECLPMYMRMFKLIIGTFEYSKIGLKIESELILDLGALKYHAYQHLISHLEFSVLINIWTFQCSLNTSEDTGHALFIFTVTEPNKICLFIVVFWTFGGEFVYQPMQAFWRNRIFSWKSRLIQAIFTQIGPVDSTVVITIDLKQ